VATDLSEVKTRLWEAADQLRANSELQASEYSQPVLGLIFLRFAEERFAKAEAEIGSGSARNPIGPDDYKAKGVLFLPPEARYEHLLNQPEAADVGRVVNNAMSAIEDNNAELKGVLPKVYGTLPNDVLVELLRILNSSAGDIEGDGFGLVYEYFLGQFAMAEGQGGGEFFTPTSIVRFIVEVLEPYEGKVFDPACGSGGMFVQSADFVERHQGNPASELSIYGQEKSRRTVPLAKMNLAVHGLSGDILVGNSYYEDRHDSVGKFDFVMANPPFNVDGVDPAKLADDQRFPFGLPLNQDGTMRTANYLWIQSFLSSLTNDGRAGFVMANAAGDARDSELEIRRKLIEQRVVDVIVAVGSNMFLTVTLPVTLWFFDQGKANGLRLDEVLFIDAREIYNVVDRAHRDWTDVQVEYLSNIVRLWRGNEPEFVAGSEELLGLTFPDQRYGDVPGLCASAAVTEIEEQGWSLNPGRYVGVAGRDVGGAEEFETSLGRLESEFLDLVNSAGELEDRVGKVLRGIRR